MRAAYYEKNGPARDVLQVGEMDTGRAGPRRGAGPASHLRRQSFRREEPRRPQPQDRVSARHPAQRRRGRDRPRRRGRERSRVGERVWVWNGQWRRAFGTAAEDIVLPAEQAVRLPAGTSLEAGACLGIPVYTAWQAVEYAGIGEGSTVLIAAGAGAVGHYAIQLAKLKKATVLTTVSSPAKAELARQAGADHVIDYKHEDVGERVMAITQKRGVDAVIEMDLAVNAKLLPGVLRPDGIVAVYGGSAAEPAIPFQFLLQNSITLRFFLVYLMPAALRTRATAEITRLLERTRSSTT